MKNFFLNLIIYFSLFIISCQPTKTDSNFKKTEINGVFSGNDILNLTLQMNLDEVLTDIKDERKYHDAILIWEQRKIKVKVRTRGNFRRDPEICNFPPLHIQFDSLSALETPFESQKRLALVTHCQKNDPDYEQITLEEYGIYKTYNLLTDKSMQVRLLKIKYQDAKNPTYLYEKLAFFIENIHAMSVRIGGKVVEEKDTIRHQDCNSFLMAQAAVFEFMIGNTDWSISNKHNVIILKEAQKPAIPVIYDFDFSGLIAAPYASPTPELGLKSVKERLYRGFCQSEAELNWVLDKFKSKQKQIDSLWKKLPYHQTVRKQKVKKYISDFYQITQNKDSVRKYFFEDCR